MEFEKTGSTLHDIGWIILGVLAVVVVVAIAIWYLRRKGKCATQNQDKPVVAHENMASVSQDDGGGDLATAADGGESTAPAADVENPEQPNDGKPDNVTSECQTGAGSTATTDLEMQTTTTATQ